MQSYRLHQHIILVKIILLNYLDLELKCFKILNSWKITISMLCPNSLKMMLIVIWKFISMTPLICNPSLDGMIMVTILDKLEILNIDNAKKIILRKKKILILTTGNNILEKRKLFQTIKKNLMIINNCNNHIIWINKAIKLE